MKSLTYLSLLFLGLFSFYGQARITALFHPYDPTLANIAAQFREAQRTIDIAVYNIDSSETNPIIAQFKSPETQAQIQSGQLQIRILFEGYDTQGNNLKKMAELESMGIDARHLDSGKKMHHKFAVIDGYTDRAELISGSANWSMSSFLNYNENILFFDDEPGIAGVFQEEFELLWSVSKSFGEEFAHSLAPPEQELMLENGLSAFFNSDNFNMSQGGIRKDTKSKGFRLTREIVELIDGADSHIQIATTRMKLRPIYNALLRAARRGVKIEIVVTMGEYQEELYRNRLKVKECADEFDSKCSSGQNFAIYLSREDYEGHENVDVRLKYFHLNKEAYLTKQMHSKYILVDAKKLLTGSFNWSYSAEYGHIENLIGLDGEVYPEVANAFTFDFQRLWDGRREFYWDFVNRLEEAGRSGNEIDCRFEPMTLSYEEIDYMLEAGRRVGTTLGKICGK